MEFFEASRTWGSLLMGAEPTDEIGATKARHSRSILVADDELEHDEVQEWINGAKLRPPPELHLVQDKNALLELLEMQSDAGSQLPQIVFLDLHLKSKQLGLDALRSLKSTMKFAQIPVVIFSGSTDEKDISETNALYANSYVPKGRGTEQKDRFVEALKYWLTLDCFSGGDPK